MEMVRGVRQKTEGKLVIVKISHENAYKQLLLIPEHRKFSIIVERNTRDGFVYGVYPIQLMFGPVSAVRHYKAVSRIIATRCVRVSRMQSVSYLAITPALLKIQFEKVHWRP